MDFGPPGGIRTPGLQNRNLLRYPASPRAEILSLLLRYHLLGRRTFYTGRHTFYV